MARLKAFDNAKVKLVVDYDMEEYARRIYYMRQSPKIVCANFIALNEAYFNRRVHHARNCTNDRMRQAYSHETIIKLMNGLEERRVSVYATGLAHLESIIEKLPPEAILRDSLFDNIFVKVKAYDKNGNPVWVNKYIDEDSGDKVILTSHNEKGARVFSLNEYIKMRTLRDVTTSRISVIPHIGRERDIVPIEIWTTMKPILELDSAMTVIDASEAERDVIAMLLEQFNIMLTKTVINMNSCQDMRIVMANRANAHLVPLLNSETKPEE